MKPLEAMRQAMRRHSVLTGASDPMIRAMIDAIADNVTDSMARAFLRAAGMREDERDDLTQIKAALTAAIKGAN